MKLWHIVALLGLLLSGCSSLQVVSDYDRHVDFATLKHLYVGYIAQDDGENFTRERIVKELKKRLLQRGFILVNHDKADMQMILSLDIKEKHRIERSYDYISPRFAGYYRPWLFNRPSRYTFYQNRPYNQGVLYRIQNIYAYEEQRLNIEIKEVNGGHVIWYATAVESFSQGDMKRKSSEYINTLVEKILADFPRITQGE